jgi:hypothetical protein
MSKNNIQLYPMATIDGAQYKVTPSISLVLISIRENLMQSQYSPPFVRHLPKNSVRQKSLRIHITLTAGIHIYANTYG